MDEEWGEVTESFLRRIAFIRARICVCINVRRINENARYSARRSRCRRRARTRDQFALRFRRSTSRPPTPRRHRNYTKLSRITAVGS